MRFVLRAASVVFVTGFLACGSSDDGQEKASGPLVGFSTSACKKEASNALTQAEAYAGLKCVRWKPSESGALHVELVNFEGACGAQWSGAASTSASGLTLRAANPGCLLAACGSCIYDWVFDVKVDTTADLALSVVTDPCPGEQTPDTDTLTLPLATLAEGELCRYADHGALGWQAASLGTCGMAFQPCKSSGGMCTLETGGTPCAPNLTCAAGASASEEVCHPTCTTDADCAIAGVLSCQTGLCRPAQSW